MFQDDYILREIERMTRFLAKVLFGKESAAESLEEEASLSGEGLLYFRLRTLIGEGKVNEAENLLFDEFEKDPGPPLLAVALQFYSDLNNLTDGELKRSDFSREEIRDGLAEIRRLYERFSPGGPDGEG